MDGPPEGQRAGSASPTLLSSRGSSQMKETCTGLEAVEDPDWEMAMSMRPSHFSNQVTRAIRLAQNVRQTGDVSARARSGGLSLRSGASPGGRSVVFADLADTVDLDVEAVPTDGDGPVVNASSGSQTPRSVASGRSCRSRTQFSSEEVRRFRANSSVSILECKDARSRHRGSSASGLAQTFQAESEAEEPLGRTDEEGSEEWEGQVPAHRRRAGALTTRVSYLLEANGLERMSGCSSFDGGIYDGLGPATFEDRRWANAMDYLRDQGILESKQRVLDLLRRGAQSFGIWSVSDAALEATVRHVLEGGSERQRSLRVSGPLEQWLQDLDAGRQGGASPGSHAAQSAFTKTPRRSATVTSQAVKDFKARKSLTLNEKRVELTLLFSVLVISCYLTIPWKATPISRTFGAGLVIARITGVGSLLWVALLFLSMSRTLLKGLYGCMPARSRVARLLDANEHIHKYCGKMFGVFGTVHTIAHLLSTYRIFCQVDYRILNTMLKCAVAERRIFGWLTWPACPLQRQHDFYELLVSLTGLTGFGLLFLTFLMARTAVHQARRRSYERFQLVHNVGMVLILALLFLHGTEGWFGIGVPFVLPFCLLPVGLYCMDRILRCLRYYLFRGYNITSAVIRAGKLGSPDGALTFLQIVKPPHLWHFHAGMYAFLNLPEYSEWEWHPFTIVSGTEDETVDFIVAGVGDWTRALAQKCLDYKNELRPDFPMIAMDGPYAAPVTTAVNCQVLVAVGAGVGVTPFLALMARVVAMIDHRECRDLKEVHFYWITRSADEYLFGRRHFTRIISDRGLREKFFFHLHLTQNEPNDDAPAYIFREAVRRQSAIDREAFLAVSENLAAQDLGPHGLSVPCCWLHGAQRHDVFWVSSLVEADDEREEEEIAEAHTNHWAQGAMSVTMTHAMSSENYPGRKKWSGPLLNRKASSKLSSSSGGSTLLGGEPGHMRQSATAPSSDCSIAEEHFPDTVLNVAPAVSGMARGITERKGIRSMLPIIFGRPDFLAEIQAVGKAWPDFDVDVYVCGNDLLTQSIRDICNVCTHKAAEVCRSNTIGFNVSTERAQRFNFRCENFS